ncbi:MAG: hypothetical protein LUE10_03165 [Alistipes sp.]|nr:hypothetical protein [Alistipes sp.]
MNEENKITESAAAAETPRNPEPEPTVVVEDKEEGIKYMTRQEFEEAKSRQSVPMALLGGLIVTLACAGLWGWFTVSTNTWYTFMGAVVGIIVGVSVRLSGRAVQRKFGVIAAVYALLGCAIGNFFWAVGVMAEGTTQGFFTVLANYDLGQVVYIMKEAFDPIDIVFYVLAPLAAFVTGYFNVKIKD